MNNKRSAFFIKRIASFSRKKNDLGNTFERQKFKIDFGNVHDTPESFKLLSLTFFSKVKRTKISILANF